MTPKYKDIIELFKKGSTVEAQEKIMELREAVIELQDKNSELRNKCYELEGKLRFKAELTFRSPFYFAENDETPYCSRCWEVDKIAVHLPKPFNSAAGPIYNCPSCEREIIEHKNH